MESQKKTEQNAASSKSKLTQNYEVANTDRDSYPKSLTMKTLNPNLIRTEFVSSIVLNKAMELEKELKADHVKPYSEIIQANAGDCHAMGQVPITFIRQVLSLITYPKLLDDPQFPEDAKTRATAILRSCGGGSVGSYTQPAGIALVRKHAAEYIERRDGGISSDWQNIVLGSGATGCIRNILKLLNCPTDGKKPGIMIPLPQFSLYSATIVEYGMHVIGYYLDESKNWGLDRKELERARAECEVESYPRALVIINPGNPTGQLLSKDNMKEVIKFARKYNLFLLADEVYQDNIYGEGVQFHSFKKVLTEMGKPYSYLELASFMSCSKGYMGECGLRAGYVEVINLDSEVKTVYLKSIFNELCPNVIGQACLDVVVCPPKQGEESFDLWLKEKTEIFESFKLKAEIVMNSFNAMEGISCTQIQGAMYAFPSITLPEKAIQNARKEGIEPDVCYTLELIENTGIHVVPGSIFGQRPGTYHFRTTILPQPKKLKYMLDKLSTFHAEYLKRYA